MDIERYLTEIITKTLSRKMVMLAGPRQCGKTTLAQSILSSLGNGTYLNWDITQHREQILREEFPLDSKIICFDEIHKYTRWRNLLKGIGDNPKRKFKILVTGSAKLDFYRYGGDSLQGRYRLLRLHPLSVSELNKNGLKDREQFENLLRWGAFPEPFFLKSDEESRIWSREYRTRLVREELTSLEKVSEISLVERLMIRLPELVGSPLSINALREDLQVAHQTVARWLDILERLYAIFRLLPFGGPRVRAVKKEQKHYHFDWNLIPDPGARLENMVACHLLKWCQFREDTEGWDMELRYFRDTDKREVDFVVLKDRKPEMFVECKLSDKTPSPQLRYLSERFPKIKAIQVINVPGYGLQTREGIIIQDVAQFLQGLV